MLIRIVHMHFTDEGTGKFLPIFNENAAAIRGMPGCRYLELLRDVDDERHFTTISHWENAESLDHYRSSPLFRQVWSRVKPLFASRTVAYSMRSI